MSLDVYLEEDGEEVFWSNITHNLNTMAYKAGIYCHCWRPEEMGIRKAKEIIKPLTDGIERLKKFPEYFKQFDSPNGWGLYQHFVPWVEEYLNACIENPNADIETSK